MASYKSLGFIVLLGVAILLSGCTGHQRLYDGPVLPSNKVAVIKGSMNILPGATSLSIMSVDGRRLSPYAEQVEILPGRHVLGVQAHLHLLGGRYASGEIVIEALPGKVYELNSTSDGSTITLSIIEAHNEK